MTTNEPTNAPAIASMEELRPTTVADWKKDATGIGLLHDLKLPSGKVAQCRRVGIETFLKLGMIPNSLASVIQRQISKAQKGAQVDDQEFELELMKMLEDPSKLGEIVELADSVTLFCVVQPKLQKAPEDPADRQDDKLYVDEVDLEDKMYIFSWAVGGPEDLATFRAELAGDVGDVQPGDHLGS